MFTGVENCARTPPMLFPVEPLPWELSRSMTRTLLQPAVVRCQAILEPTIPPPTMTTSALCMLHHVYDNYSVEVTPKMRRLRNVAIHPSIFGNDLRVKRETRPSKRCVSRFEGAKQVVPGCDASSFNLLTEFVTRRILSLRGDLNILKL